jgi:hypothetical protein
MIDGLIVALSWGHEVARAVQMVDKSTVKHRGCLRRPFAIIRALTTSRADQLLIRCRSSGQSHIGQSKVADRLMPPRYNNYLNLQWVDGQERIMHQ